MRSLRGDARVSSAKWSLTPIPWSLQRTVAPGVVVTTQELKDHFRETLVDANNDTLIAAMGAAAEDALEGELARAFLTQTWVLKLYCFPCYEIRLPRPPLSTISSISYIDTAGSPITLAVDQYTADTSPEPGRILKPYGITWPATRAIDNAVTITYVCGHATAGAVPAAVKMMIKLFAAEMYENRERGQADVLAMWRENQTHARLLAKYGLPTEFTYR
jgi:uncharacterized phiE125 gp8 family phage protein